MKGGVASLLLSSLLGGLGRWGKGGKGKGKGKGAQFKKTMDKINKVEPELKVWVGGVPKGTSWKDLDKHFEETCGTKPKLTEVMAKGTAVCTFRSADEATAAIAAVSGSAFKGSTLEVDVWTVKEKKA